MKQHEGKLGRIPQITVAATLVASMLFASAGKRKVWASSSSAPDPFAPAVRPEMNAPALTIEMLDAMTRLPGNLGLLPSVPVPPSNAQTADKIALGKLLFFDTRLSGDRSMSCATCHNPAKGFTDGLPRAVGFGKKVLGRNTPTVLNAAFNHYQFWDGRAESLEEQAAGPIMAKGEMNMADEKTLVARLNAVPEYQQRFHAVFGQEPALRNVAQAIASFERTLVTPDSAFDRYLSGEKTALNEQQKRGLILFFGKASCSQCHKGPNFTDDKFHNLGSVSGQAEDIGRFKVTSKPEDNGAFKTPTLRNIALTGPYMHDGSIPTLEQAVEFYDQGGGQGANKSDLINRLSLSAEEKQDLVAFLNSLSGKTLAVSSPEIPKD